MSSEKDSPDHEDLADISTAADDPTAVWDEAAMREAGLGELADKPPPAAETAPATKPGVKGEDRSSVVVSVAPQGRTSLGPALRPSIAPVPKKKGGGLTWPVTFVLAAFLFAAVFALVRFLR